MTVLQGMRSFAIGLACAGMIWPAGVIEAAPPTAPGQSKGPPQATVVQDVGLDGSGQLRGMVVNPSGTPIAHAVVVVQSGDREVGRAETDGLGRFAVGPLHGGTYQLKVGGQGRLVRLWAANTAPPAAKNMVLVVLGGNLVRGQMPLEDFFESDTFVVVCLVAAMITIPIAVHKSGRPASPP